LKWHIKSRNTEQVPCPANISGAAPTDYSVRANRIVGFQELAARRLAIGERGEVLRASWAGTKEARAGSHRDGAADPSDPVGIYPQALLCRGAFFIASLRSPGRELRCKWRRRQFALQSPERIGGTPAAASQATRLVTTSSETSATWSYPDPNFPDPPALRSVGPAPR
jgi:hypothetical protein